MWFTDSHVDIGVIDEGRKTGFLVELRNNFKTAFTLSPLSSSCGCASPVEGQPIRLNPGEPIKVSISVDTVTRRGGVGGRIATKIINQQELLDFTWSGFIMPKVGFWIDPTSLKFGVVGVRGEERSVRIFGRMNALEEVRLKTSGGVKFVRWESDVVKAHLTDLFQRDAILSLSPGTNALEGSGDSNEKAECA